MCFLFFIVYYLLFMCFIFCLLLIFYFLICFFSFFIFFTCFFSCFLIFILFYLCLWFLIYVTVNYIFHVIFFLISGQIPKIQGLALNLRKFDSFP